MTSCRDVTATHLLVLLTVSACLVGKYLLTYVYAVLIINSNLGPIFPRFRVTAAFLLKRATPPLFDPNFGGVSLGLDRTLRSEERRH